MGLSEVKSEIMNDVVRLKQTENLTQSQIAERIASEHGVNLKQSEVSRILIKSGNRSHKVRRRKRTAKAIKRAVKTAKKNAKPMGRSAVVDLVEQTYRQVTQEEKYLLQIINAQIDWDVKKLIIKTLVNQ